jgi:bifunctional UDP-N-acetylglucosamine pyrophosphorylase / glucosamine-1-phosphate N-acetyltransferase
VSDIFAVILAAGKGTRMKSDLAKVLHELEGKPLLSHVLDALSEIGAARSAVIVGHQAEAVARLCDGETVETALQEEQLGTGHAVLQAREALEGLSGHTLILCGDVPLIRAETLRALVDAAIQPVVAGAVLSAVSDDATGYGRILRDDDGSVVGIVEEKDATDAQRSIHEYNTGTYCFDNARLWTALDGLSTDNAQGEFYLTDVIEILVASGHRVEGVICGDEREVQGINTVDDLARATADARAMRGPA